MSNNVAVGKYTVKRQCSGVEGKGRCSLFDKCQTSAGRQEIALQIQGAVKRNNPSMLPIDVLAGKHLAERPDVGGVCMHLARLIGTTLPHLDLIKKTDVDQALEWAVEHGFSTYDSINQPRE